jgi:hypothetical protein
MVDKGNLEIDKRGLIFESYRIDGIVIEECRSIFLDWALGAPDTASMQDHLAVLMETYGVSNPDHPMTKVITEGMVNSTTTKKRRGGRAARVLNT